MSDELIAQLIEEQRKTREAQEKTFRLLSDMFYANLPPDALLTREQVAHKFNCQPGCVGRTKETAALVPVVMAGKKMYPKREVDAVFNNLRRNPEREAAKLRSGRK